MDLFRMQCFVYVAEQLNLTRAAEIAGISQPAMSVQMRELEREMGASLLNRDRGRISLTEAGKIAYEGFSQILEMNRDVERRIRNCTSAGSKGRGLVRVGYHGSATAFSSAFRELRESDAPYDVSIKVGQWSQLVSMVIAGQLDVAFVERHEIKGHPELDSRPMFNEDFFCVAVSRESPLANETELTIDQLSDKTVFMSGYASAGMAFMSLQLEETGISRDHIRFVDDNDAEIAMAASGLGVAAMPRFLASPGNTSVKWIPVRCKTGFSCPIDATWRRDTTNPYVLSLVDFCGNKDRIDRMRSSWVG
jgi:DNA-binding transcriptional LysR family regulator